LGLLGEGEGVAVALQNGATHEHVHNLCAHVRSKSPKTLRLPDGQAKARHFLKLGADTNSKMLNIHLCDEFLQLMDGLMMESRQTNTPGLSNDHTVKRPRNSGK
jgi:hypothetical protein